MKQVELDFSVGFECVTESPSAEQFMSFVSFGFLPFVPSNVPTGTVSPTTLICRRMPLNVSPVTHTVKQGILFMLIKSGVSEISQRSRPKGGGGGASLVTHEFTMLLCSGAAENTGKNIKRKPKGMARRPHNTALLKYN